MHLLSVKLNLHLYIQYISVYFVNSVTGRQSDIRQDRYADYRQTFTSNIATDT